MAMGSRIRFFRKRKGLTQKQFGELLGFNDSSSETRLYQYEIGEREPREDLLNQMAQILGVSPKALKIPDIDNFNGLIHTLFALEDMYGFEIENIMGEPYLHLVKSDRQSYPLILSKLQSWEREASRFRQGEITKDDYDLWRYLYPKLEDLPDIKNSRPTLTNDTEKNKE
jgi:transcriptional regulator with XRE-family HTH domain